MDYILMDGIATQKGDEKHYIEQVIYLPDGRFCYAPPVYAPEVSEPPIISNGYITFGCFNNTAKITAQTIRLWAEILRSVTNSRLVLKWKTLANNDERERFYAAFERLGIERGRIELRTASPHPEMLKEYGDIDIALDPFPFSGGLTSCEALWMGVPVISLFGNTPVSRQSYSFLKLIGLDAFAARNEQQYLDIARQFSEDLGELTLVRAHLRSRMAGSTLCDGTRFTVGLEAAFRTIWGKWCGEAVDS